MSDRRSRIDSLREALATRVLVLDGATGTMMQRRNLGPADFGGEHLDGCNEHLVVSLPEVVLDVHRQYLEAGADIIETNTFGGSSIVLEEYGLADRTRELNRIAAGLARQAADEHARTSGRARWVAGSIGPTTKAISVTGGISFEGLIETFRTQCLGLLDGGVDLMLIETCQDTRNIKAALIGLQRAQAEHQVDLPIWISGTIEANGTMLAGQGAEALAVSVSHVELLALGLNCATGPELMTGHLRSLSEIAPCAVSCYPNAGLPDEDGNYKESPIALAAKLERFVANGWINIIGGCCGTTEEHIAAIASMVDGARPRSIPEASHRAVFSGIELVEADADTRPLLVGERSNLVGSRRFRRLLEAGRWDEAAEIARKQVAGGAQIVDVCLQSTEIDEKAAIPLFYEKLIRQVKAPIMIDTTDPEAIALALTYCQGRSIVNSINLEDGLEKFAAVVPMLRRFGAAVVVGCIDEDPEQAQAFSRERKLAVARRSRRILVEDFGLRDEDLIFDALVFPCASGDAAYVGGAVETLEGLRLIKQEFPDCQTILGISNVSFGMPANAREALNSVFLYHATKAGLDLAIVNTERLERYPAIIESERQLAEALLFNRPPSSAELSDADDELVELVADAPADWREQSAEQRAAINQYWIAAVAAHFRGRSARRQAEDDGLDLDQRLSRAVVDGLREGLVEDLEAKLAEGASPLEVINGPLMRGMDEVGRLFNDNQLIVAEVLQSAEVMKAAVAFLESFMDESESSRRGSIVLATVKGDVHDIGKNLVEIILENNGWEVHNLGIKVGPAKLIEAVREIRPDAVGLSGLLVKSAHQMVATVEDFSAAGIDVPVLVGGAALSKGFVAKRIDAAYSGAALYCSDAMNGLEVLNRLADPSQRQAVIEESRTLVEVGGAAKKTVRAQAPARRSRHVRADIEPVAVPELGMQTLRDHRGLDEIWSYMNLQMLLGRHLGLRGSYAKKLVARDPKAMKLKVLLDELKQEAREWMRVQACWRFFDADSHGNHLRIYDHGADAPLWSVELPRQAQPEGLCLADYPLPGVKGRRDSIAAFVVSAGAGVRERAEAAKESGELLKMHAIQALALETAEACAEWLHRRLRETWGFPDPAGMTMLQRFRAEYRGCRYSFGYPACPDLEMQRGLWALLRPDEAIGVELTDGDMMEPEASVSALVFHHPDAKYFSVGLG